MATTHKYDADRGQYVLEIYSRTDGGEWVDYCTLKSQSELDVACLRAEVCRGAGLRPGVMRVVHRFMGTNVLVDVTRDYN